MTRSRRVLVIDDEPQACVVLGELLSVWGYDVETAQDVKRALEIVLTQEPDMIVSDLALRGGDPCTIIRRLRAHAAEQVYIIAFSGWYFLRDAALAAGADAFILKPDIDELEHLLAGGKVAASEPAAASSKRRRP